MPIKNISILLLVLFITSCVSSKKTIITPTKEIIKAKPLIKSTPKQEIKIIETIEKEQNVTPQIPLPPKPPKQDSTLSFNHNRWNKLLQQFVTENGEVDYKKIKGNRFQLDIYIDILSHNLPKDDWSKNKKLAYWVNAYNALTVDLIIKNYPVKSIKDIKNPWKQKLWKFGDKWYNLEEIEHQILRKMDEPRIHFAIVCASYSCPKLQNTAFTAKNLEEQLTKVTQEFLSDPKRNEITKNSLKLSKIFKWFNTDFKQNGSLIHFLNQYTSVTVSEDAKMSYKDYNWDLND